MPKELPRHDANAKAGGTAGWRPPGGNDGGDATHPSPMVPKTKRGKKKATAPMHLPGQKQSPKPKAYPIQRSRRGVP